ncbi:MAG: transcriptional regulator [Prevotellaceae bacterium]|jgi:uncharacterized coiled-coil protein SlyX/DNA-binding Xre family transcriptional regulator|nr:transcriptional regulator [Prevotellaceae bacterium]
MLHRLKEYMDYKKIRVSTFEKSVGMSNASLVKPIKSGGTRSIGVKKLEKILKIYPDLNPTWLLIGEGEMLISKPKGKKIYKEAEGVSLLEEPQAKYENKIAALKKTIERLNRALQEKEEQLREKDAQISKLIHQLEK